MKKWSKFAALGLTFAMVLGTTACGNTVTESEGNTGSTASSTVSAESSSGGDKTDTSSGDPITLTFWNGFTGTDGEVLTNIVNTYNETNDKNITIEMDIMPWDTFYEKLPPAIATETAPDFVLMPTSRLRVYGKESLASMNDYFDYEGSNKEDFQDGVLDSYMLDGEYYSIPMQIVSHYLFWDKDLFKAAGLDPDTPPATMEQLGEYAKKLTDKSKNQYGFAMDFAGTNLLYQYIMFAFGDGFFDEETATAMIDTDDNLKAMTFAQDLWNAGVSPADIDDTVLCSGQVGMFINGSWMVNGLRNAGRNFGVAAVPAAEGEEAKAICVPVGFEIPITTSEEKKLAAYDFIRYWNSTEVCKLWTQKNGVPPYLKSVAEDEEIKNDSIVQALIPTLSFAYPQFQKITTGATITADYMRPMSEEIGSGADVKATLEKYQEKVDKFLEENK
ncbi:ABC transporter substrate-binding protein [Eisenbergiella sp.]